MNNQAIVIKSCECDQGKKKTYLTETPKELYSKTFPSPACNGCDDEIFSNKFENGEWIYCKGDTLCKFKIINFKYGGLVFYEERKL